MQADRLNMFSSAAMAASPVETYRLPESCYHIPRPSPLRTAYTLVDAVSPTEPNRPAPPHPPHAHIADRTQIRSRAPEHVLRAAV
eukprot:1500633-Prymnesium_polylepis.1